MKSVPVLNREGKATKDIDLPEEIFNGKVNTNVLYQAVNKYRASLRSGTASTKERAYVSGGGVKPFRQKGTGRARAGSIRSPLWAGGGVVFGPHPRNFAYSIPRKIKTAALRDSLLAKIESDDLCCVEDFSGAFSKTKEFVQILKNLDLKGRTLAILDGSDQSIDRVTRNIPYFSMMRSQDVNAFDILRNKKLLVTNTAMENLIKRIKRVPKKSPMPKEKVSKKDQKTK